MTIELQGCELSGDEVVYVSTGDGTTSQGEFWESLSTASAKKLPVLFVIEDNEYAISVPVEVQTRRRQHLQAGGELPELHFAEVDGTDPAGELRGHDKA